MHSVSTATEPTYTVVFEQSTGQLAACVPDGADVQPAILATEQATGHTFNRAELRTFSGLVLAYCAGEPDTVIFESDDDVGWLADSENRPFDVAVRRPGSQFVIERPTADDFVAVPNAEFRNLENATWTMRELEKTEGWRGMRVVEKAGEHSTVVTWGMPAPAEETRTVTLPAREEHAGNDFVRLTLPWVCLDCGGPRGEPYKTVSWDGSRRLSVDGWRNPCGHIEKYSRVREAFLASVPAVEVTAAAVQTLQPLAQLPASDRAAVIEAVDVGTMDREALNAWYEREVGYRPDDDNGAELPLDELRALVAEAAAEILANDNAMASSSVASSDDADVDPPDDWRDDAADASAAEDRWTAERDNAHYSRG